MTDAEKKFLLKELSAKLQYGVKVKTNKGVGDLNSINQTIFGTEYGININAIKRDYFNDRDADFNIMPYLRPMSSMTEEEIRELKKIGGYETHGGETFWLNIFDQRVDDCLFSYPTIGEMVDFLDSRFVDFRMLIPLGLALEAEDGMYNQ